MAKTFDIGDEVRIRNTFSQDDVAIDPTTVALTVKYPDATTSSYTYAGSTITRESTGVYSVLVTPTMVGPHWVRWSSTGTGQAAEEGWFEVRPRRVT